MKQTASDDNRLLALIAFIAERLAPNYRETYWVWIHGKEWPRRFATKICLVVCSGQR
jgi:hypothetical protein